MIHPILWAADDKVDGRAAWPPLARRRAASLRWRRFPLNHTRWATSSRRSYAVHQRHRDLRAVVAGRRRDKVAPGEDPGRLHGRRAPRTRAPARRHASVHLDRVGQPVRRSRSGVSDGLLRALAERRRLGRYRGGLLPRASSAPHRRVHRTRYPREAIQQVGAAVGHDRRDHRLHDHRRLPVPGWRPAPQHRYRGGDQSHVGRRHHVRRHHPLHRAGGHDIDRFDRYLQRRHHAGGRPPGRPVRVERGRWLERRDGNAAGRSLRALRQQRCGLGGGRLLPDVLTPARREQYVPEIFLGQECRRRAQGRHRHDRGRGRDRGPPRHGRRNRLEPLLDGFRVRRRRCQRDHHPPGRRAEHAGHRRRAAPRRRCGHHPIDRQHFLDDSGH